MEELTEREKQIYELAKISANAAINKVNDLFKIYHLTMEFTNKEAFEYMMKTVFDFLSCSIWTVYERTNLGKEDIEYILDTWKELIFDKLSKLKKEE